ncbi:MAG: hypothetical protein AAB614_01310 [Patescibacteria group bacterium]
MISKTNRLKISFFLISALLSFLTWSRFKDASSIVSTWDIISVAILLIISIGFFTLLLFIFNNNFPLQVFALFLFVFVLILDFHIEYIIVVILALLFFVYAHIKLKNNIKNNLKVRFHSAVLYGTPSLVTAFAVLFASVSYFYPFNVSEIKVSPQVFSFVTPFAEQFIKLQTPTYQVGMTIDDFLVGTVSKETGVSTDLIKKNFKSQLEKQRKEFADGVGVSLSGDEKLNDIITLVANSYISKYLVPNESIIPIIFAIFVFLTIKSSGFILNRASVLFATMLFKIMVFFKLIRVEIIKVDKEVLSI